MMKKIIAPDGIAPPASAYHHGLLVTAPQQTLYLAGQLGEAIDGSTGESIEEQTNQAWANVKALLAEAEMSASDIVKVTSYIVGRENISGYVACHKEQVGDDTPPWTLILVAGLGAPHYLVELDVVAAK